MNGTNPTAITPLRLLATGSALPSIRISSEGLDDRLGKSRGYVRQRSGLSHRYHAAATETQAGLGAAALREAVHRAGITPSSIDLLISACAIPVQILPCTATHLIRTAGLPEGTPGFDVNMSCASFVVALGIAGGLLQTTSYRRIAIVSSELPSRGLNWDDEDSSLIFGDGAACAIVERGGGEGGIAAYRMESYVNEGDWCEVRAGGTRSNPVVGMRSEDFYFAMRGRKVFKMAARYLKRFQDRLLDAAGCEIDDIDWIVPHQASHLGLSHAARALGLREDRVVSIYRQYGNQVAASIPTALHELATGGRMRNGQRVMLLGTAASLSLAGMVLVM